MVLGFASVLKGFCVFWHFDNFFWNYLLLKTLTSSSLLISHFFLNSHSPSDSPCSWNNYYTKPKFLIPIKGIENSKMKLKLNSKKTTQRQMRTQSARKRLETTTGVEFSFLRTVFTSARATSLGFPLQNLANLTIHRWNPQLRHVEIIFLPCPRSF